MSKLKLAPLLGVVLALPAGAVMAQTPPSATGAQAQEALDDQGEAHNGAKDQWDDGPAGSL